MSFENKIRMIATMQYEYAELVTNHKLSKKAMCDLCCPVRDALSLTDIQTLQIARKEISLYDIIKILDEKKGTKMKTQTLNKHMLSDEEYTLVNKLAGLSGMACWFMLVANGDEFEVHDLEDNVDMSLTKGLKMLFEGISSLDDYSCTNEEKIACRGLCERLGIKFTV